MKKIVAAVFAAVALFLFASTALAQGYHYVRQSTTGFIGANGFLTLPQWYAANPQTETYPEFFYGMYAYDTSLQSYQGLDIGIGFIGGSWKCISWAHASVVTGSQWSESAPFSASPSQILQLQALLIKNANNTYKVQLDVYDNNGTILTNLIVPVTTSWANYMLASGYVNRELSLATNTTYPDYLNDGSYFYNAKWGKTWLIDKNGGWSAWNNNRSSSHAMYVDPYQDSGGQWHYPSPSTSKYGVSETTDGTYAFDEATIHYD